MLSEEHMVLFQVLRVEKRYGAKRTSCAGGRHNMPPPPVTLTFWPWKWCPSHVCQF